MKKVVKSFSVLICIMMILSACSSNSTTSTSTTSASSLDTSAASSSSTQDAELEPVELIYYVPDNPQPGLAEVNAEINKYLTEKINATIKMNILDFASYAQKMNVLAASGTPIDIMWSAYWHEFSYPMNVTKGTFLESEELFKQYAPLTYADLGKYWDTVKINGKIYGMPNQLGWSKEDGYQIKVDLAEKYGLTNAANTTMKIEDLEIYLEKVKANEPGKIPLLLGYTGLLAANGGSAEVSMNLWDINRYAATFVGDKSFKVVSFFETPEFKNRIELARKWFTKGYINKDAATNKNIIPLETKAFAIYSTVGINSDVEKMPNYWQTWGGPIEYIAVSPTWKPSNAGQVSMLCIGKNSKNSERAAMFLELTHTQKDLVHLFCYGIKGKHYTSDDGIYMKPVENSGYSLQDWINVNCHLKLLAEGQSKDTIEKEIKKNDLAMGPEFAGFVFNPEPVKTEVANCNAVFDEYLPGLATGTVDTSTYLPKFISKLKVAGLDKIIAETQDQMDAWKTAAGK